MLQQLWSLHIWLKVGASLQSNYWWSAHGQHEECFSHELTSPWPRTQLMMDIYNYTFSGVSTVFWAGMWGSTSHVVKRPRLATWLATNMVNIDWHYWHTMLLNNGNHTNGVDSNDMSRVLRSVTTQIVFHNPAHQTHQRSRGSWIEHGAGWLVAQLQWLLEIPRRCA